LNKSQEYRICLLLEKQKVLLESDLSTEELSRAFIVSDNEFHYSLYELAGRKNVIRFYNSINSQYERFRTFINLGGREGMKTLHQEHEKIWNCIVTKNLDELETCLEHHLYNGFNSSMKTISEYPMYFVTPESTI